jgi:tetratricopeptide (TPR) repeat protein
MKKILLAMFFFSLTAGVTAQQEDIDQLHENAKAFMQQGDYGNATLILTRALQQDKQNLEIAKDLSMSYFLQKEDQKALDVIKPFIDNGNADDQAYQIAGTIYRRLGQEKEADKNYKDALKKFPSSGGLYNDYGELLFKNHDPEAIKMWEKGIEADPSFGYNYYNASKYYYYNRNYIWSLLYGETFINIESFTSRTAEIKDLLLNAYKRLFADPDLLKNAKDKSAFEIAFLTCMNKQNDVVIRGINPETLTMIRTRFILDWNRNYAQKFPFKLFQLQEQLLEEGLFPAYNQWIFGASQNLAAYQNWTSNHAEEADNFRKFKAGIIFKIPKGEYYH